VVGIGASAGGLQALSKLLPHLPIDSGMAFLLVQHLAPTHKSALSELLSRKTKMPVGEAVDGQLIEPNHVYVIPPNTTMTLSERRIKLQRRNDQVTPMPIDDLFRSLADEVGPDAIGIVLSGSGSDGAFGLRAIQAGNGIAIVQDQESAAFGAMPRSAVEIGAADFVLPPASIGEKLLRISRHQIVASETGPDDRTRDAADADVNLNEVFGLLSRACNIDFSLYKRGTIIRRLERRMLLHHTTSMAEYVARLAREPGEARLLCHDFLINVTSFFREPESFADLARFIWPRLLESRPPKRPVRIWVPGCASGEEVYSIAMSLLEFLGEPPVGLQIQVFGTDVSETAILTARAGLYAESIASQVSSERLERFFERRDSRYRVKKSVRELCIFSRHDVTRDPPFSRLDLLSCRNLLIYLGQQAQKQLFPLLHYALNSDGYLLLGRAESVGASAHFFRPLDEARSKIYSKKPVSRQAQNFTLNSAARWQVATLSASDEQGVSHAVNMEQLQRQADRVAQSRYVPAGVLCDEQLNVVQFRGETGPYLANPDGPPTVSLQKLARPELLVAISNAVEQARQDAHPVRSLGLRLPSADGEREIDIEVVPIATAQTPPNWFLVFFLPVVSARGTSQPAAPTGQHEEPQAIERLAAELESSQAYTRSLIEQHFSSLEELKSAQEELLSSNEEFRSTNEELETAKEELQSLNEELTTTNDELRYRNIDLVELSNELRASRDFADAVVDTVREPLLILDEQLCVKRTNRSFDRLFKTDAAKSEGRLLYELEDGQWDIPGLRRLLEETLASNAPFDDYEVTHDFPAIGRRNMLLNARRLEWRGQSLTLLAFEDETERKQALDSLHAAHERTTEFLAMLGHELRNPLAAMRSALHIIAGGKANTKTVEFALAIMNRQLAKEARLLDDLIDIARITTGGISIERNLVDLRNVATLAVEEASAVIKARNQDLHMALPDTAVYVQGDATRLEQVVVNLLINSSKFTPEGGRIRVELVGVDQHAELTVNDDGMGIASDVLPAIFDLFVQAQPASDRGHGGLGLGLTLVRRIVELHDGTVHAQSAGLNQGATFTVRLPMLIGKNTDAPGAAANSVLGPPAVTRILLVEDNVDAAASLAALLELDGHEVKVTGDGPSALGIAETFEPRVLIVDIGLPQMDGHEVARRLRKLPQTRHALLIALTGYGQAADLQRSVEAGFDHHLVKPSDPESLGQLIAAYQRRS